MDRARIDIDDNRAVFERERVVNKNGNNLSIFIILIVVFAFSLIIFLVEYFENEYIKTLRSLVRIKKNLNSTAKIVDERSSIEVRRNIMLKSLRPDISFDELRCYDMGSVYVAGRINPNTNVFEFIRRGKGSYHTVQKAGEHDIAAKNFCQFLIQTKEQRQLIGCGKDMYEKLGYSDFLQKNSICSTIVDKHYKK